MKFNIFSNSKHGNCKLTDEKITFTANGNYSEAFFEINIRFVDYNNDWYIFMPSCLYNGNKFKKKYFDRYPPKYDENELCLGGVPMISDLPALNVDGSGCVEVTSGDMATPCFAAFDRKSKKIFFFFGEQEIKGQNIGYTFKDGTLTLSYPTNRSDVFYSCGPHLTGVDKGIDVKCGETLSSRFKMLESDCANIPEFYKMFLGLRKSVMSDPRAPFMYTKQLWNIMENHFNTECFSGEYYAESSKIWQCGWCGGAISNYPLLKYGNELSIQRAIQTADFLTSHQAPSGFYYSKVKDGEILDDSFGTSTHGHVHLIRKSGDSLYYLLKIFEIHTPKPEWIKSAKLCADAFVKLFERYGTFGQFVDAESGEMLLDCSESGAMAVGALGKAYEYFNDEKYLNTAKAAMRYYYSTFCKTGISSAGPGDILSAPDSESAFALLESSIVLYEIERSDEWLNMAQTFADYCSSWVVTYKYKFPENSEFTRLDINTVGSVFANVQNKHSAPGICTHSGDSLLKLYRYTGNREYLELIKDIAYFIPQCVSTEEKPIFARLSWSGEPTCKKMPAGFINERVNMSDWERKENIGEVFCGSCWCETSLILSFTELMTQEEMLV